MRLPPWFMVRFEDMINGYRRFRSGAWQSYHERWETLTHGQKPKVMVIACSDSRVEPTNIFDTHPGEIFVVRNVAALVPPFETTPGLHGVSAALEFAVQVLGVSQIVVLGHGSCGGCQAALSQGFKDAPPGEGGFIANWIQMLDDARERVAGRHADLEGKAAQRDMEFEAVKVSLENLRTFPCIKAKEAKGNLTLHGAFFAIHDGVLHLLDEATDKFSPVH